MHRRSFLAHALRVPAALAALPFVGGLTALAGASEPEVQSGLTAANVTVLEEQVPVAYPGLVYPVRTVFEEADISVQDGTFLLRQVGPDFVQYVPLGVRSVLVRGADAVLRRWELGPGGGSRAEVIFDEATVAVAEDGFLVSRYGGSVVEGADSLGTMVPSILVRAASGTIRRLTIPWLVR